ncbi:MAG: FAD-dependent oxidoreductase [Coriobacteriia bacterium]
MTAAGVRVRYLGQVPCAEGIATFRFAKPEGYMFTAGQFFTLSLNTRDGEQSKHFSHASAPEDADIELTTRLTGSAFKDALLALAPGTEVTLTGPRGRLVLPASARNVGFLTGGVGITPARSIIRHLVMSGAATGIALFNGNRSDDCVPYGGEFRALRDMRERFTLVEVIEQPTLAWESEVGRIDAGLVRRYLSDPEDYYWIVSGPPPMVGAMRVVVDELGLPGEAVAFESFAGYAS